MQYVLKGLITVKDIQKKLKYPNASKDAQGRLRVAGAIGATGDYMERAAAADRDASGCAGDRFGTWAFFAGAGSGARGEEAAFPQVALDWPAM